MKYILLLPFIAILIGMCWVAFAFSMNDLHELLLDDEGPLNSSDADPPVPPYIEKP